ncbi:unnamed protein product [Cuscuta campestris]|uniref:Uncharacterized protein n=1 Tax=Cuscuta campestris TaxID=132261 RepID=A0A484M910_9ASTE|nr:unnamed protein product [Cuscuta campestris]
MEICPKYGRLSDYDRNDKPNFDDCFHSRSSAPNPEAPNVLVLASEVPVPPVVFSPAIPLAPKEVSHKGIDRFDDGFWEGMDGNKVEWDGGEDMFNENKSSHLIEGSAIPGGEMFVYIVQERITVFFFENTSTNQGDKGTAISFWNWEAEKEFLRGSENILLDYISTNPEKITIKAIRATGAVRVQVPNGCFYLSQIWELSEQKENGFVIRVGFGKVMKLHILKEGKKVQWRMQELKSSILCWFGGQVPFDSCGETLSYGPPPWPEQCQGGSPAFFSGKIEGNGDNVDDHLTLPPSPSRRRQAVFAAPPSPSRRPFLKDTQHTKVSGAVLVKKVHVIADGAKQIPPLL